MKKAMMDAELILKDFNFDAETKDRLKAAIAELLLEQRRSINNDIQHRLGCLRLGFITDIDTVRKEIESVLHPTPIL